MRPSSVHAKPSCPAALGSRQLDRTRRRQLVMTPGTNRRRTIYGAVDLAPVGR
jgi:hypothetical protein